MAQPRENVRTDTPEDRPAVALPQRLPFNPRTAAVGVAACLGIVVVVAILMRSTPEDAAAEGAEPSVVEGNGTGLVPISRPAGSEARAERASNGAGEELGFLTVEANAPAVLRVDGQERGRTPVKRMPIAVGTRALMLESVDSGEQKSFALDIELGKERKVVEYFQQAPSVKRKR